MAWWTGQPVYGSNPVSKFIRENFAYLKTYVDYIVNSGVTTADLAAVHATPPTLAAVVNITGNTAIGATDVGLGGGYNISGGITLTINGAFSAPLTQIFFGAGAVSFVAGSVSEVRAEWFPPTVAGLTSAVAATPAYGTLRSSTSYSFATTWTVNKSISVIFDDNATITFAGAGTAVDLTAPIMSATIKLDVRRATDWTAGNTGILIHDMIDSIVFASVRGFQNGLYLNCAAGSIAYNKIFLNEIWFNQYGVHLNSSGGVLSFVNANVFYGGRFAVYGATNPADNRYGIYCEDSDTNVFYHPTIELEITGGAGVSFATFFNGSDINRVDLAYIEGPAYVIGASGTSRFNKVQCMYGTDIQNDIRDYVNDGSSYPGTNTIDWMSFDNTSLGKGGWQQVFTVNNLLERAILASVATANMRYVISGFSWLSDAGAFTHIAPESTYMYLSERELYLDSHLALGRKVDTSVAKDFRISISPTNAVNCDVVVKAYDVNGGLLTAGTHVRGLSSNTDISYSFAYAATWGGAYVCYTLNSDTVFLHVESTVKSIWIGVTSDNVLAGLGINGISVFCNADLGKPYSSPGYDLVALGGLYNQYDESDTTEMISSALLGGVFSSGKRVWNIYPATGDPLGWVTAQRRTTTANGGEPAGEVAIAVNSIAGSDAAGIVGIVITRTADATTRWWWSTINGAPAAGVITITDAIPVGYTVGNGARVITYNRLVMANVT